MSDYDGGQGATPPNDPTVPQPNALSYNQRRARIVEILRPWIDVTQSVDTTTDPNPVEDHHGLVSHWGLPGEGSSVYVRAIDDDQAAQVAGLRDLVNEVGWGSDEHAPFWTEVL